MSETSDRPKHVEVETAGIYSSDNNKDPTESDFEELTQLSTRSSPKKSRRSAVRHLDIKDGAIHSYMDAYVAAIGADI